MFCVICGVLNVRIKIPLWISLCRFLIKCSSGEFQLLLFT
jgi:hypothetical protein